MGQKKSHVLWVFPSYEQVTCCADNIAIYFSQILYVACRPGKNKSGSVRTLLRTELTDGSRKEMTNFCNQFALVWLSLIPSACEISFSSKRTEIILNLPSPYYSTFIDTCRASTYNLRTILASSHEFLCSCIST